MAAQGARPPWTVRTLSEHWGVPEDTLRRWRKDHVGPPSYRLGRLIRYDADAVDAWLAEQQRATAHPLPRRAWSA